jgi:hypothetical protein
VSRVGVSVQQANSDRLNLESLELGNDSREIGLNWFALCNAAGRHAGVEADAAVTRDQHRDRLRPNRIDVAAVVPSDLQHVLKACCRDERTRW